MLVERALTENDIPLLATIDRTELIQACYRMDRGELVLYAAHHDMRGWPEGEAEQDAVALRACLQRGGWLWGVFDGQALVAAAVVDNRTFHHQGLLMRQLKFLHVSHAARGSGLAVDCWCWPASTAGKWELKRCISRPRRRVTPWTFTCAMVADCCSNLMLSCMHRNR